MIKVLPYKHGSKSAKSIQQVLPNSVMKSFRTEPKPRNVILNWGNSHVTFRTPCRVLNKQSSVANAVHKLRAFNQMSEQGVRVPPSTTSREEARRWLRDGWKVLARYELTGHSGEGIYVLHTPEDLVEHDAPLYVKYLKKKHEFRVHVFCGEVIDYIEKKAKVERDEATFNEYIRSHQNGWMFCRDGVYHSDEVKREALKAVSALGLDFGAVDVIIHDGLPYVLEVNTAPALEGTTLERYAYAINSKFGGV